MDHDLERRRKSLVSKYWFPSPPDAELSWQEKALLRRVMRPQMVRSFLQPPRGL